MVIVDKTPENLPVKLDKRSQSSPGNDEGDNGFIVGQLHLHANDYHAIERAARIDIDLANKMLDQRDAADRRYHMSHRFGVSATVFLLCMTLGAFAVIFVNLGIIATLLVISLIFALALLIRVILTGKWSDTSWFGKLVNMLGKRLGSESDSSD